MTAQQKGGGASPSPAHPNPVTIETVTGWFLESFGKEPDKYTVTMFVQFLNAKPPQIQDGPQQNRDDKDCAELAKAIAVIIKTAPRLIKLQETLRDQFTELFGHDNEATIQADNSARNARALLMGAKAGKNEFPVFPSDGKKKPPPWRVVAKTTAWFIERALTQAGHEAPTLTAGPGGEVFQRAMEHLEGKRRKSSGLREVVRERS